MIISCNCGARLKVGDDKLTAAGVKIRCPKCSTVHMVRKEMSVPAADTAREPARTAAATGGTGPAMPWFAAASPDTRQARPLVLIAHDSSVVAEMIASTLARAGMATAYAANGLEALKKATELRPQGMVVDVGLTGIYGFELCERLKGEAESRDIKIVLLSSVYGLTAYKRAPVTLYGADDYIEKHHIPDQLVPKLQKLFLGGRAAAQQPAAAAPAPVPEETAPPASKPLTPPLMSKRGLLQRQPAAPSPTLEASAAPSKVAPVEAEQREIPAADTDSASREPGTGFETPAGRPVPPATTDAGDVVPGRQRAPESTPGTARKPLPRMTGEPGETDLPLSGATVRPGATRDNGSVKLDALFFENEEYEAPEKMPAPAASIDPFEVEKAKRFARIIVSDIALYNQEAVKEGIRAGNIHEVLRDDIAEGRTLYDSRVPQEIRATKDYLQEALDNFIASKKKLR